MFLCTCVCDISEYLSLADSKLFKSIQSSSHCLSHILPPEKNLSGLRSRGHAYVLPICQYSFFVKKIFIPRCLFYFFVIVNLSVWFVFWCFLSLFRFSFFSTVVFVICCFTNKEISSPSYDHHFSHDNPLLWKRPKTLVLEYKAVFTADELNWTDPHQTVPVTRRVIGHSVAWLQGCSARTPVRKLQFSSVRFGSLHVLWTSSVNTA